MSLVHITPHLYFVAQSREEVRILPSFFVVAAYQRRDAQLRFEVGARLGAAIVLSSLEVFPVSQRPRLCFDLVMVDEDKERRVARSVEPSRNVVRMLPARVPCAFTQREHLRDILEVRAMLGLP